MEMVNVFECVFEKQGMIKSNIGIAGNVVDDTEEITILSSEAPPEEFPWWMILAAVGGAVVLIGLVFAFKGR